MYVKVFKKNNYVIKISPKKKKIKKTNTLQYKNIKNGSIK